MGEAETTEAVTAAEAEAGPDPAPGWSAEAARTVRAEAEGVSV